MASDNEILKGMIERPIPDEVLQNAQRLIIGWTDVTDRQNATVQAVFVACIQIIRTMGPAWCRIGAATLANEERS
jgi:hypothetical protein